MSNVNLPLNDAIGKLLDLAQSHLRDADPAKESTFLTNMTTSMVLAGIAAAVAEARNTLREGQTQNGEGSMEDKIDTVLIAIHNLIEDESKPWTVKKEMILRALRDHDERETALKEFVSWFAEETD